MCAAKSAFCGVLRESHSAASRPMDTHVAHDGGHAAHVTLQSWGEGRIVPSFRTWTPMTFAHCSWGVYLFDSCPVIDVACQHGLRPALHACVLGLQWLRFASHTLRSTCPGKLVSPCPGFEFLLRCLRSAAFGSDNSSGHSGALLACVVSAPVVRPLACVS